MELLLNFKIYLNGVFTLIGFILESHLFNELMNLNEFFDKRRSNILLIKCTCFCFFSKQRESTDKEEDTW